MKTGYARHLKTGLACALSAMAIAVSMGAVAAEEKSEHPGVTEGELRYKGAPIPLEEARRGVKLLEDREVFGKVVVVP